MQGPRVCVHGFRLFCVSPVRNDSTCYIRFVFICVSGVISTYISAYAASRGEGRGVGPNMPIGVELYILK